ncbi:MAG: TIM barrel protein [Nocardiopsaceae bacterium]|jgi:inosose dehydratase|nr:TIM barrel protein [Nocardiopsaceae bacterium]
MVKIGNAPVSYGAFEVTVGKHEGVPTAAEVLDAVQAAGYDGIDLGPLGYLGLGEELRLALSERGLMLTGGYVEIDVSADEAPNPGVAELRKVCDQFDIVAGRTSSQFLPRPTVALIGTPASPGEQTQLERWNRIERVVNDVVNLCGERGYQAVLHNEVGTQISSQESVIRVLESTPAALCLDTGHLVAAGGDPLAILQGWRDRVAHVHLKDAKPADAPFTEAMQLWEGDVFCRLGAGRGRVEEVLGSLRAGGYEGWIVVEQDVLPRSPQAYRQASADQQQNRAFLRERGW